MVLACKGMVEGSGSSAWLLGIIEVQRHRREIYRVFVCGGQSRRELREWLVGAAYPVSKMSLEMSATKLAYQEF